MKPPRSDRSPSRAPAGKAPTSKAPGSGRAFGTPASHGHSGPGGRSGDAPRGKPQGKPSYAQSAEAPRNRNGNRPEPRGERFERSPAGQPFRSERPSSERPQSRSEPYRNPQQPRGERPNGERPSGERPRIERSGPSEHRPHAPAEARLQSHARDGLTREREVSFAPRQPRANAETPRGTVWIYGTHAAQAALTNPARRIRRLLTTEEGAANLASRLPQPWSVQPETVDRARLDHLLGREAVHQGVAVLADLLPQLTIGEVLERPGPVLVLDQVTDPRNIGAILRAAAAFGVAGVILQERHAPEETGSLAKAASGALETVPLLYAVNLARTIVMLKAANCWVVGLDADAKQALHGPAFAERRVALVLGAEGEGLRRLTRESCDELTMLPMPGAMESLNVSAAAAVALYELTRKG